MPVLEIFKAAWVIVAFIFLFVWVPGRLFARNPLTPYVLWVAGNFVRMLACVAATVFILTGIKALGYITAVLFVVAALAIAWLRNHDWQVRGVVNTVQNRILKLVHKVEGQSLTKFDDPKAKEKPVSFHLPRFLHLNFWLALLEGREVLIAGFVLVMIASSALLWQNPIHQLRYEHVEQYSVLLRARQFALNLQPIGRPFIFPSALVATSLISAVDLAEVTRFVSPVIGIFLVISLGIFVRICVRTGVAAIVAMYCFGAAALPPPTEVVPVATTVREKLVALLDYAPSVTRPGTELAIGMILLLLGLAFLADWHRNGGWDSLIDAICCVAMVAIISQYLLIAFLVAGAAMLLSPIISIVVLFLLMYGTAIYATLVTSTVPNEVFTLLPLAAAIAIGAFIAFVHSTLKPLAGKHIDALVLAVCLIVAALWVRPNYLVGQFLEYEEAAQQTKKINTTLPRQRWEVIAPVEQLPETFGFGGYEDLALWVQKYKDQVGDPEFHFKDPPQDMLIYVEKNPFQMYAAEPAMVSFATLTDATYRNYRSPAGRASLESDALQLCEKYRANHADMTTFYEDQNLKIYRIHTPPKPTH
jgi:hypothetical protein